MQISNIVKRVVAVAAMAAGGSVVAAPISVGFNFIPLGGLLTASAGDITTSTSVSFTGGSYLINTVDLINTTNNIGVSVGLANAVDLTNPMPLTVGAAFTKTFTAGGLNFTETLTVTSVDIGSSSRGISAQGTISCGVGCGFDDTTVYFSASYTQNGGPTAQINASFNNSTVPPPVIPEPGSMALVGLALAGLALTARRRAAK